ncbi:MAG TPA: TonB-dependent receptor, partial [Bryobacteraceae bacterium]
LDLTGKIGTWDLDFAAGYTEVDLDLTGIGYVSASNLQEALDSTTNPYIVGGHNTPTVLNFVAPQLTTTDTSKLAFGHVGLTNSNLVTLRGGSLGFAVGADYFDRKQHTVAPQQVADGFITDFSNNFTVGTQQVASGYAEFDATLFKQLEVNLAGRYDHYNLSGGKFSPKVGVRCAPSDIVFGHAPLEYDLNLFARRNSRCDLGWNDDLPVGREFTGEVGDLHVR